MKKEEDEKSADAVDDVEIVTIHFHDYVRTLDRIRWYRCVKCGDVALVQGFDRCPTCGIFLEWDIKLIEKRTSYD